ncbi:MULTISPECIES: hypothetical protein [unclassified Streptomyces]|uniref:hypothetical protein n=1 Tax=unclassified Streptomyces TaxID=2593676 RepID=UPI00403CB0B6
MLTARHVLFDGAQPLPIIELRFPQGLLTRATLVWHGKGDVDAALVSVDLPTAGADPWQPPADLTEPAWGVLTGSTGVRAETVGFPDSVRRRPLGPQEFEQVEGVISPLAGRREERYLLNANLSPRPHRNGTSRWRGLSGAAVVCNRLVCGVLVEDAPNFDSMRLGVVPLYVLAREPEFRRIVEAATGRPLVLESVELQPHVNPWYPRTRPHTPAALLRPEYEIVPFHQRTELDQLLRWCLDSARPSGSLVVGRGGQGKSRLARELCSRVMERGWAAGILTSRVGTDYQPEIGARILRVIAESSHDIMLVADYAEASIRFLRTLLEGIHANLPDSRLRVLMLARSEGEWWENLLHSDVQQMFHIAPISLSALPAEDLSSIHGAAVASFRTAVQHVDGYEAAGIRGDSRSIDTPSTVRGRHALAVFVSALAAVLTAIRKDEDMPDDPMDIVLDHEYRYWERVAHRHGLGGEEWQPVITVALLAGADTNDEAETTVGLLTPSAGQQNAAQNRKLAKMIHDIYPAGGSGYYWGTLEPDGLKEHYLRKALSRKNAPALLEKVLPYLRPPQAERALGVLGTLFSGESAIGGLVAELVRTHPDSLVRPAVRVALRARSRDMAARALRGVDVSRITDADILADISREIPPSTQILTELALALAEHRVRQLSEKLKETTRDPSDLRRQHAREIAKARVTLAYRFYQDGKYCDGLRAARKAVQTADSRRWHAKSDPEDRALLASALRVEAILLNRIHRRRRALSVIERAVAIRRKALADPRESAELVTALRNKAMYLHERKRYKEALEVIKDAVDIQARFSEFASQEDRGTILFQQSRSLFNLGRYEQSLAPINEAVSVRSELAKETADTYLVGLADVLVSRCMVLVYLNQFHSAREDLDQAFALHKNLTFTNRDDRVEFLQTLRHLRTRVAPRWLDGVARIDEHIDALSDGAPQVPPRWPGLRFFGHTVCSKPLVTCWWTCTARRPR